MIFSSFDEKWGLAYVLQDNGRIDRLEGCLIHLANRFKFKAGSKVYGFHSYLSRSRYNELLNGLKDIDTSDEVDVTAKVRKFCVELYHPISGEEIYWLDDHIINGLFIPEILRAFPEAKFIHPIRDGREVAKFFIRKGWARSSYEQSLRLWHSRVV